VVGPPPCERWRGDRALRLVPVSPRGSREAGALLLSVGIKFIRSFCGWKAKGSPCELLPFRRLQQGGGQAVPAARCRAPDVPFVSAALFPPRGAISVSHWHGTLFSAFFFLLFFKSFLIVTLVGAFRLTMKKKPTGGKSGNLPGFDGLAGQNLGLQQTV